MTRVGAYAAAAWANKAAAWATFAVDAAAAAEASANEIAGASLALLQQSGFFNKKS
jgi:hypothetical protein